MDNIVLDTEILGLIVTKLLQKFDEWNLKNSVGKAKYHHVDVTLTKNGTNYTIQATNYGQCTRSILHFSNEVFNDFIPRNVFFESSQIAIVYARNEYENCQTATGLRFAQKCLSLTKKTSNESQIDFSHQKNYLSLQLQHKLHSEDCEEFSKIIVNEILRLQQLSIHTKFTVHCDRKVLASALTDIIKHSVNIKFKENCFSVLGVNTSHEVETTFMVKLLPLIHENYIFSNN